jgi:hypothetical protein
MLSTDQRLEIYEGRDLTIILDIIVVPSENFYVLLQHLDQTLKQNIDVLDLPV